MQNAIADNFEEKTHWLETPIISKIRVDWEIVVFTIIIILAIASRFYDLDARVMSHDENSHVYFSWLFSRGQGYSHDPVTHGPLQFHLIALSYFLFGDNDTTARLPAAIFSIAAIAFLWNFRRYLGRTGAITAALLFLISPYMLYYGRYARNEAYVALFGLITIWAILRYLEYGEYRYLYWLTAATVLHFTSKETSYIYTAQALLFLGLYFIYRITAKVWKNPYHRTRFLISLIIGILLITSAAYLRSLGTDASAVEGEIALNIPGVYIGLLFGFGILSIVAALYFVITGFGFEEIRKERSFDLLIVLGTLVLPLLTPFLINLAGWKVPVNASEVTALTSVDIIHMATIIIPVAIFAIAAGIWWNARVWLINAGIFYAVFTVFYTTIFTNGTGFFTGLVGSLGYWLAQQAVERGSQPTYYYYAVQIPVYEYLPALGSLLTVGIIIWRSMRNSNRRSEIVINEQGEIDEQENKEIINAHEELAEEIAENPPSLQLIGFWVVTSILAYTIAGEKMPWLTVHITLPMILFASWGIGQIIDGIDWAYLKQQRGWLIIVLIFIFITSLISTLGSALGDRPPFQGNSLDQLRATSTFLIALVTTLASGIALGYLLKQWSTKQVVQLFILSFVGLLAVLTMRTAFTAAFINYDQANELLVYAHSAPGVRIAMDQVEEISLRLTGSRDLAVAYDNETSYPFWWYLRNYKNQRAYAANPTRDLRETSVILVGDDNFSKLEPIVGQAYQHFEYIRIWWPNQDYYNLTWERIRNAISDPQMRAALFQIWLNRDYTKYGQITNKDVSYQNWSPGEKLRLYIRKDVASQLWNYGIAPSAEEVIADPYEGKQVELSPDLTIGAEGFEEGQFRNPRNLAIAPDGTIYVADTFNHRIQHMTSDGEVLHVWGSFSDIAQGEAPGGTFNEPWGIAVASDGSVFVADTWNHRIQKFTPEGEFVTMWGFFGQAETPLTLWGPREVAVDAEDRIYITDTGNKRIVIFDQNGEYLNQFGEVGFDLGQFNEPVGVDVDQEGNVYIADTWNQRIQVMSPDADGNYQSKTSWDIIAWYGQSLENKPYLVFDSQDHLFVSDPTGNRILEFNTEGDFVRYWGDTGAQDDKLNIPLGLDFDVEGHLWVADSGNHRIVRYTLPEE
jgi:uncharacterized protein (TIGR03663 family)